MVIKSLERAYLLMLNAVVHQSLEVLPNIDKNRLKPALIQSFDYLKKNDLQIETNKPPQLFCQLKEVLRHETFLISNHNLYKPNLKFLSFVESPRMKRKFVYDSHHKFKSLIGM